MPSHSSELVGLFADAGGIFAILTFVHFMADFVFQTFIAIDEKYNKRKELTKHSFIYAIQFLPVMFFFGMTWLEILVGFMWMMGSHFVIDSMWITHHWVRHIYRPPELALTTRGVAGWGSLSRNHLRILIVDHIQHLFALWPLVIMTLY